MTDTLALVGANPAVTLIDGDEPVAFASLWRVDWSPRGSGTTIVLWYAGRVRVFGSDTEISRMVEADFTQYFPEVQDLAWSAPEFVAGPAVLRSSLSTGAVATAPGIEVEISGLMDRREFSTADFPLSPDRAAYGLRLVLAPASDARIIVDGVQLPGRPRTGGTVECPTSSAFVTDAEVWTYGTRMPSGPPAA